MARNDGIAYPTTNFASDAEEMRRQLAAARDAQSSSEVDQRNETVLSNIMLPGHKSEDNLSVDKSLPDGIDNECKGCTAHNCPS